MAVPPLWLEWVGCCQVRPHGPPAQDIVRQGTHLRGLRQGALSEARAPRSHDDSHRRETICVVRNSFLVAILSSYSYLTQISII